MEPENYNKCDKRACCCLNIIIGIVFAFILGVIGLILGVVYISTLIGNLGVLIATASILGFFFILLVVYKLCACKIRRC